jgi:hypothetical protein
MCVHYQPNQALHLNHLNRRTHLAYNGSQALAFISKELFPEKLYYYLISDI